MLHGPGIPPHPGENVEVSLRHAMADRRDRPSSATPRSTKVKSEAAEASSSLGSLLKLQVEIVLIVSVFLSLLSLMLSLLSPLPVASCFTISYVGFRWRVKNSTNWGTLYFSTNFHNKTTVLDEGIVAPIET